MTEYIYVIKNLNKYNSQKKHILKNVWLSFLPGAKIGIIGPNGAGKSTLLNIMAGIDKEFDGEAWPAKNTKIGYLPQEPSLDKSKNVIENIMHGATEIMNLIAKFNEISNKFSEPLSDDEMTSLIEQQGEIQEQIDKLNGWEVEREAEIIMQALNCPPKERTIDKLSGGEKRRVAIAKLLMDKSDMLLLDEPTNHLDAESVAWLEKYLQKYKGTVVTITHDRYFLDNVTEWILEIDRGECIPWHGNYSSWLDQKSKELAKEDKQELDRQKQIERELEWIRQSPKARGTKNKARIKSYEQLVAQQKDYNVGNAKIVIPEGPRLGDVVINVNNLTKAFGDKKLINNLSFNVPPGAIVGIIGPNGAGKSTFFKMVTGQEQDFSGEIKLGQTVSLGYVDQSRDHLQDHTSVWEEISEGKEEIELGKKTVKSRAYCASFNFKGPVQQKLVSQLSGGERNRVHLAKMLKKPANVILLDEPTNDLDVNTLRSLEEAILNFAGCVLVISHDRWFLDRVATHILAFEKDKIYWHEGNYSDFEENILNKKLQK
ncbi:MAG: energy-dependent translational throttle protein EttA [Rickettsiales bacterium]|nr:energy-dependent translational throttle protein EttA [Rickettsiales bacterium]